MVDSHIISLLSPKVRKGAIGYIRVSTQEQADSRLSLDAQRDAIERECQRRGWRLLGIYEDAGLSGKDIESRPGLQTALRLLKIRAADGLVVTKLDRLSRSIKDAGDVLERALDEGWALTTLDFDLDTSTPQGEAMAGVLAVFNRLERRMIGQRTKEALAQKKAQGFTLGRPVELKPAIESRIVAMRRRGLTLQAIADRLNASKVPTARGAASWLPTTVARVVNRNHKTLPQFKRGPRPAKVAS